ncbi:hypothetical protein HG537_0A02640 [Torulaspora globosa]|uniref:Zn(2)-C6 fungal-type domain-containing protein n=1 Tax=Torulaspora globosa TaxID=48254 RepID=A0A7H9HMN3_9SACH|nr:hypothetical protein HG537_0A02640 [Torulaspora sp. CBS 2947]
MESLEIQKSKHPCGICAKRKVKCDRLIPCTNCVKRGFEKECLERSVEGKIDEHAVLKLWQSYEYWVTDIGLFKSQEVDSTNTFVDLKEEVDECQYWCEFLTREISFQLLDHCVERLGCLHFGCLSDISDLYLLLEEFWQRRDDANGTNVVFSVDDHYSNALLWSLFALAVYYMPLELLSSVFTKKPSTHLYADVDSDLWTERDQLQLSQCFTNCAVIQLHEAKFLANPEVRLLQVYVILSATGYPHREVSASNALLLLCFNVAKLCHVDDFRPLITDSTAMRLTKITCEKIWYSLCSCDYLQSGPRKPTVFNTEISSLLQHAAYLDDLPNTDVYQSEDSFEALYWKILSLDRDLNQYLIKGTKPPLKTLDAIQRQTDIFTRKITSSEDSASLASDFARFLVSFLLNTISWKLHKMYFIYFDITNGLAKSVHYTKNLVALVVKNIKNRRNILFNKHPIVIQSFARIAVFYAFYEMVTGSVEIRDLNLDLKEMLQNLSNVLQPQLSGLFYLISRFRLLKTLWESMESDSFGNILEHPAMIILQNDINTFSQQALQRPSMIRGSTRLLMKRKAPQDQTAVEDGDTVFNSVVAEFESQYAIDYLTRRNREGDEF